MVKSREEFLDLLTTANHAAQLVAGVLSGRGYHVRILPHTVTPNVEDRWQHTDDGDLEVTQRIEVKHWPEIDFKKLDDVPYANVIVDEAYKIEKPHATTLFAYMILNASMTAYLLIPIWTRVHWFKEERPDGREGSLRLFFFCPKRHVTFHWLIPPAAAVEAQPAEPKVMGHCHKHGDYEGDANCPGCEQDRLADW